MEPANQIGLGDVVEKLAHPVAVALRLGCVDKATGKLKPDSKCAKRRLALNRFGRQCGILIRGIDYPATQP